jgi:hypothetical protein
VESASQHKMPFEQRAAPSENLENLCFGHARTVEA